MNLESVTIEDCIDMLEKKCKCTVINDGKVVEFIYDPAREERE